MSNFNDWINIELMPMSAFDHVEDLEDLARQRVGKEIERRVKATLDPGIDPRRAVELSTLRVESEGSTFVIKTDDSQEALSFGESSVRPTPPSPAAKSVDDLFKMSSGVPEVHDGKLVYKTVSLETLFGTQTQMAQDEHVEHIVEDTLRNRLPDAYGEAFAEIARRHPTFK